MIWSGLTSATRSLSTVVCSPYNGGAPGVRDRGLLASTLARPRNLNAHGDNPDVIAPAAAYAAGIIRNHPFVDGNKRTGFVVAALFLEMNGYRFTPSEEGATQAILGLADETLNEAAFLAWLRANSPRIRRTRSSAK